MSFGKDALSFLNGFRKFTMMVAILFIGILFRMWNFVTGAEFVELISTTAIAFFGTNAAEHITNTVKEWIKSKVSK